MDDGEMWPSGSFRMIAPFTFSDSALDQLRLLLADKTDEYVLGAASCAAVQRWLATEPVAGLKEVRAQLECVKAGGAIQAAAAPHLAATLLVDMGVANPRSADAATLAQAATLALNDLAIPRPGRPRRPAVPGRDLLEEQLAGLFARLTGKSATSATAIECSCIVLVALGLLDETDPESRQRAARRRKRK
jgi:hypothetical protein